MRKTDSSAGIGGLTSDSTEMISTVLNGRWFSSLLDEHYGNESLWVTD